MMKNTDFWSKIHDSEIAKKHKGQVTKVRQMIQNEQGVVEVYV